MDQIVDYPVQRPAYRTVPGNYNYHRNIRYYYNPPAVWLYPPVTVHFYANPYPGISYYPNGYGYRNYSYRNYAMRRSYVNSY
jgi:hypothetical protein